MIYVTQLRFMEKVKDVADSVVDAVEKGGKNVCDNSKKMAESYIEKYLKVLNGEQLNPVSPKLVEKQMVKLLDWK